MTDPVLELSLKAYTEGSPSERHVFSQRLMTGLKRHGFIILRDHDIDLELLRRAYALAQ
jgi:isopenicillin N synthase-like dioxygenase